MNIKYDKAINASYIKIKKGKISNSKEIKDDLIFDMNKNREVVGIEILAELRESQEEIKEGKGKVLKSLKDLN